MNKYSKQIFKNDFLEEKYEKYVHSSGLEIYVFPKELTSTYALFGVKYGSVNNSFVTPEGKQVTVPDGIAHFLEHKLFFNEDGTDSFERFSEFGADANAFTSNTKTAYLFSCTDGFEQSLRELITFVTHPYFTPQSVESEIGIISEEIQMYEDNPSCRCYQAMLEAMYSSHSVRINVAGSLDSIRKISADMLYDCYRSFYKPSNMALVVCGNVSSEQVLRITDECLPDSFLGECAQKINENKFESRNVVLPYIEQQMQVSKPMFCVGIKDTDIPDDPLARAKKDAVMSILNETLFSAAGRFYNDMFEKNIISPALVSGYTITDTFAHFTIEGEADDPSLFLKCLTDYIEELKLCGIDRCDFDRAKKVMFSEQVKGFDSTEGIGDAIFSCAYDGIGVFDYFETLNSVSYDDVQKEFQRFFEDPSVTLSVIKPIKN